MGGREESPSICFPGYLLQGHHELAVSLDRLHPTLGHCPAPLPWWSFCRTGLRFWSGNLPHLWAEDDNRSEDTSILSCTFPPTH